MESWCLRQRLLAATSTDRRNTRVKSFCRRFKPQRFAWPVKTGNEAPSIAWMDSPEAGSYTPSHAGEHPKKNSGDCIR
jgi:hypothetical protein